MIHAVVISSLTALAVAAALLYVTAVYLADRLREHTEGVHQP